MQIVKQIVNLLPTTFPFHLNGNLKLKEKRKSQRTFSREKTFLFAEHAQLIVQCVKQATTGEVTADVEVFFFSFASNESSQMEHFSRLSL